MGANLGRARVIGGIMALGLATALAPVAARAAAPNAQGVSREEVEHAIRAGVAFLLKAQRGDGTWSDEVGQNALVTLALLTAGESPRSTPMQASLGSLRKAKIPQQHETYGVALVTMALAAADPDRYRDDIAKLAEWLERGQTRSGAWTYNASGAGMSQVGDNSNTQYALLLPREALVNLIVRDGEALLPRGSTVVEPGDELHLLVRRETRRAIGALTRRWREGPLDEPAIPKIAFRGSPQIFSVRPTRAEDGDTGSPTAISGVDVATVVRTRSDVPRRGRGPRRRPLRRHRPRFDRGRRPPQPLALVHGAGGAPRNVSPGSGMAAGGNWRDRCARPEGVGRSTGDGRVWALAAGGTAGRGAVAGTGAVGRCASRLGRKVGAGTSGLSLKRATRDLRPDMTPLSGVRSGRSIGARRIPSRRGETPVPLPAVVTHTTIVVSLTPGDRDLNSFPCPAAAGQTAKAGEGRVVGIALASSASRSGAPRPSPASSARGRHRQSDGVDGRRNLRVGGCGVRLAEDRAAGDEEARSRGRHERARGRIEAAVDLDGGTRAKCPHPLDFRG